MTKTIVSEKNVRDHLLEKVNQLKVFNKGSIDKKVAVATARDLLVVDELQKSLAKVFKKGWCVPPKYEGKRLHKPCQRIVNVLLSDLHFGAHLDPYECPIEYNTLQESRRLGRVALQVADYKRHYRKETKLIVHLLGDIIQAQLHDPRDGDPLTQQFATSVHYLTQLVLFWCSQFPSVEIFCTSGNHGRNMARNPEKAVDQKWDSIETMIYYSLKEAILNSGVTNCKINIPKTPYYTVQLFDSKLFGTHGDTVLRPGNPGKSIQVDNLSRQICKFNSARNLDGPFQVFCVGHIHVGSITNLPGGVTMITNGCLIPTDAYALSVGYPDNTCGQYLWESVQGHAIGDQRFIVVDGAEDKPKYNDIIKPFQGL